MSAIVVQAIIGGAGEKAATTFSGFSFNSLCETKSGIAIGANKDGLHLINSREQANLDVPCTVIFGTTDFGIRNSKRLRKVYVGVDTKDEFVVSVKVDNQAWRAYTVPVIKEGLQRRVVPIGRRGQGRYWTVKITSSRMIRIDNVEVLANPRPSGIKGY